MNLSRRLLFIGGSVLLLQLIGLYALFYYAIEPKVVTLEKSLVEKNLHRSMELLQRELFNLEHLSELLAEIPLIQEIVTTKEKDSSPNERLQKKMLQQDINLMVILDNDKKVLWEALIDLNTEQPYPTSSFLSQLWEYQPDFFHHYSPRSQQSGIYPSALGPILIVSESISTSGKSVQGILIVGKLITSETIQLIQSLSFTDMKLWPLEGASLSRKHSDIIKHLLQSDTDIMIEKGDDLLQGYISLPDLNTKSHLLISTTLPRDFNHILDKSLVNVAALFILPQILFLMLSCILIRKNLSEPARQLMQQINSMGNEWHPLQWKSGAWNEITLLTNTLSNFMSRQQNHLNQETTFAYRQGMYQARQDLFHRLEDTLNPLAEGFTEIEKKLSNLPINDIEWIIAESKTGQISMEHIANYTESLQTINEKLRHYQKETRNRLYELHNKTMRNTAILKAQARCLDPIRQFTPVAEEPSELLEPTMARS